MTLLTSNSNQVQRVQSKPEYMEDARRRTKPHKTKLQAIYIYIFISKVERTQSTSETTDLITEAFAKGCASSYLNSRIHASFDHAF